MRVMSENEARARELELREREILLLEERAQRETRTSVLDWVRGLALPIASLLASGAIFLIQTHEMAFQDSWESAREGYKQYFDGVRAVRIESDASYEEALGTFLATTQAFPEIFCGARQDFAVRVDRSALPRAAVDARLAELRARAAPRLSVETEGPLSRFFAARPAKCADIVLENEQAMASADPTLRSFRVWVHLGPGRTDRAPLDVLHTTSGPRFRFVDGPAIDASAPTRAEVRYLGHDERAAAELLASRLSEAFASDRLSFTAMQASEAYANLPRNTLEVFIPDPPLMTH